MNVAIESQLEQKVRARVDRGDYSSADELVQEAVQRLMDEDDLEAASIDSISRKIKTADAEIDAGHYVEYDATTIGDLARDVHARGLAAHRSK
jgi:Arc/MetJ-type ribon-helix-helix transcriptional regulator